MDKILYITNLVLLLTGFTFLIMGIIMYKFPAKKMNGLYGYRTASSMQSQTKWDFAQKYSAKVMLYTGLVFITVSFYKYFFKTDENTDLAIGMFIMIVGSFTMIPIVDKKLKQIP